MLKDMITGQKTLTSSKKFSKRRVGLYHGKFERGLRRAGRVLDKHGNRSGSVFPRVFGNYEDLIADIRI